MKKILIISGGISKERAISLDTGKQVAKELKKNNYFVKIAEPNFQLFDVIKKFKPNKIFNALHGQFGEDGCVQGLLEIMRIPYTGSSASSWASRGTRRQRVRAWRGRPRSRRTADATPTAGNASCIEGLLPRQHDRRGELDTPIRHRRHVVSCGADLYESRK